MDYSVIIPVYDEEDAIIEVYHSVRNVMAGLGDSYEILFVNDGSTDRSLQRLLDLNAEDVVIVSLEHVGQAHALQAGFDHAAGDIYITLDGDGQDDPAEIPRLLEKLSQGYDVVCGWRQERRDPLAKKISSRLAYLVRRLLTHDNIHDVGCKLRVFRRKDMQGISLSGGLHRFFTLIMHRRGCRVTEVRVVHHPRRTGVSKYGFWNRLPEGGIDLFRVMFIGIDRLMAYPRQYKVRSVHRI